MNYWILTLSLVVCARLALCDIEYAPTVQVAQGKVRGIVQQVESHKVHLYQGIRYGHAERFEKAKFVEPWTGVYDAIKFREKCPQPVVFTGTFKGEPIIVKATSEHCLYLNIWKPAGEPKHGTNRSVMVFIHGGTYVGGTIFSAMLDGKDMANQGDVIMVTIQYRLGALGLINGGDAVSNLGLRDQILALQWIQQNIHHFGGDPNSVTLFGESSGSINVGHLVISPLAKGLFSKAIMQSGAPHSVLGEIPVNEGIEKTKSFAKQMHCPTEKINDAIACLKKKSIDEFVNVTLQNVGKLEFFLPVYGDEVLPVEPLKALQSGQFNHVDLMFGVVNNEGSHFVNNMVPEVKSNQTKLDVEFVKQAIIRTMKVYKQSHAEEIADFYTANLHNASSDELITAIGKPLGDLVLVCPTVLFAEHLHLAMSKHAQKARFYSFRLMQHFDTPLFGARPAWQGVLHGEDTLYLFVKVIQINPEVRALGDAMMRTWTSFAKTGNPGKLQSVQWDEAFDPHQSAPSTRFMALKENGYQMISDFYKKDCESFWKARMM